MYFVNLVSSLPSLKHFQDFPFKEYNDSFISNYDYALVPTCIALFLYANFVVLTVASRIPSSPQKPPLINLTELLKANKVNLYVKSR
jgi:hypothetical protein